MLQRNQNSASGYSGNRKRERRMTSSSGKFDAIPNEIKNNHQNLLRTYDPFSSESLYAANKNMINVDGNTKKIGFTFEIQDFFT
jgi:hypothetical protein